MRLQYIFHGNHKGKHPFNVKPNWIPPVQPSVALESYLENVKVRLAEITTQKPKYDLSPKEHRAVKELKYNTAINLKKADKGSTTVIPHNVTDKLQEGLVQLNNRDYYQPLENQLEKSNSKSNSIFNSNSSSNSRIISHIFNGVSESESSIPDSKDMYSRVS